ncbi:MAG: glycosyltransferase family 2 protein, partial [Leadbetterella sp.]|nr:glycosyltransferase family 2 protein [Leadbetterella sp.]
MKISGFTFLRNAHKLYYPIAESINSILEIVDEFVVALGKGDENDNSLEILQAINSPKIKIIYTEWDLEKYPGGTEYAHQTDLAKWACSGDWLFYLQGDEVVHEDDLKVIKDACIKYNSDQKIEGLVFNYLHFWGDYEHYFSDHCWYKKEIRIIRNLPEIHAWKDAQSFRFIPDFDGNDYHRKRNTRKLNCI